MDADFVHDMLGKVTTLQWQVAASYFLLMLMGWTIQSQGVCIHKLEGEVKRLKLLAGIKETEE